MGSLNTLNRLREKGLLSDDTYADLLKKAQASVWARLITSTSAYTKDDVSQQMRANPFNLNEFSMNKLKFGTWFIKKEPKL